MPGTSEKLKDTKGRSVTTITAEPASEDDKDDFEEIAIGREDQLLTTMNVKPGLSLTKLAAELRWTYENGKPNSTRVHQLMLKLSREKLVVKKRGRYHLTPKGMKAAADVEAAPDPARAFVDRLAGGEEDGES